MKIYVEHIFLPQFRIFGALIILFGLPGFYAMDIHVVFKILLWSAAILIGAFLLFGTQEIEINREKKQYRSLISILNIFNSGSWKSYQSIENLFIKRSKESQNMAMGPIESTVKRTVFDAYLKVSDREKLFLGSDKSKERLLRKIKALKSYLEIPLVDHSV
ncbi:MAG: hypothetical protein ACFHWX_02760 [Bacteroidota bacterium]